MAAKNEAKTEDVKLEEDFIMSDEDGVDMTKKNDDHHLRVSMFPEAQKAVISSHLGDKGKSGDISLNDIGDVFKGIVEEEGKRKEAEQRAASLASLVATLTVAVVVLSLIISLVVANIVWTSEGNIVTAITGRREPDATNTNSKTGNMETDDGVAVKTQQRKYEFTYENLFSIQNEDFGKSMDSISTEAGTYRVFGGNRLKRTEASGEVTEVLFFLLANDRALVLEKTGDNPVSTPYFLDGDTFFNLMTDVASLNIYTASPAAGSYSHRRRLTLENDSSAYKR